MLQNEIKECFIELGLFLEQFSTENFTKNDTVKNNSLFYNQMVDLIDLSQSHNGWFTKENVCFSLASWAKALTKENIEKWLSAYNFSNIKVKKVGLILAGNIPLVGFHDFLSVLITGHKALIKTSSNDQHLIQFLSKYLISLDQRFQDRITFVEGKLENFDAVIATGSNNTARYFEFYFKEKPSIIRKNRNSVAILTGKETPEDLTHLGEDIFKYFGLGCRNVSKIFIPKNYSFDSFFNAMFTYQDVIKYDKYANNYDYNKAVYLMSNYKLLDNGFLTLKEDENYASPISSVFYEHYENENEVAEKLQKDVDKIQCIVSKNPILKSIQFGQTQKPNLWDYADNIDTIAFLTTI
ncbi:acyl-CoA reductase [Flavobacterium sp. TP390]|uniref:Acyl-CoA reductase n=1 Tax=Flavobacterium profundi TaxID=1774945 RepID=A0A6I4ITV7_9FLAO|nr:acyl-CoA reductase [Flavobacterium profundi]MVO10317.1 acyl-CoA reductase [Flavobacterium profundi]